MNGELRTVSPETTIAALLVLLGAHPEGVAVALNGEVVPRATHAGVVLREGARVEVIRAVGGG